MNKAPVYLISLMLVFFSQGCAYYHGKPSDHFDGNKTLWGGFVIQGVSGRILFMGDTAYGDFFKDIRAKFSPFRLAILPIGSYEKREFMKFQHMNPEEAVTVHQELKVRQSIGIHFATFREHPEMVVDAQVKDLKNALIAKNIPESEFLIPGFGESRDIP